MTSHELTLLQMADHMERQQIAYREDLQLVLFPKAERPPSERDISQIRQCLAGWVLDIETYLLDSLRADNSEILAQQDPEKRDVFAQSWPALAESGLLRDEPLIGEALGQIHHKNYAVSDGLTQALSYMARLCGHEDSLLADGAMKLSGAYLRLAGQPLGQKEELSIETLNLLTWRIVAVHEILDKGRQRLLTPFVRNLLARHDEGGSLLRAAGQLAHKLIECGEVNAQMPELLPKMQGLPLTLALLSLASGIPSTDLVCMAAESGKPRLLTVLRALGYEDKNVGLLLNWLSHQDTASQYIIPALELYRKMPRNVAMNLLQRWRENIDVKEGGRSW